MCGRMNQLCSFSSFYKILEIWDQQEPFNGLLIRQALYQNFGTSGFLYIFYIQVNNCPRNINNCLKNANAK